MDPDRNRFGVAVGAGVLALVAMGNFYLSKRGAQPPSAIEPAAVDGGPIVPAAIADSEGALPLRIIATATPGGRRLSLEAGGGTAVLTIRDPAHPSADFGGFGRCTIEAPDRK